MRRDNDPSTITVTVVDDEPVALDVLMRAARTWRFGCQGASSAEEAAGLIRDYTEVTAELVAKNMFPGPARLLGFTGQKGAFSWRE